MTACYQTYFSSPQTTILHLLRLHLYIQTFSQKGNLDWVGSEFALNAGAGLVIQESENKQKGQDSIVEQLTAAFERDWFSPYTISLLSGSTTLQESQHGWQKLQSLKTKAESREHE